MSPDVLNHQPLSNFLKTDLQMSLRTGRIAICPVHNLSLRSAE